MRKSDLIVFMILIIACNSSNSKSQIQKKNDAVEKTTEFSFDSEMHNFGKIKSGEIVIYSFVFTNTGKYNLSVKDVKIDCGCIKANFAKKPVKPGEKGLIEVEFDTSGLFGNQFKSIIVEANVPEPKQLAIFAQVNNEQLKITY